MSKDGFYLTRGDDETITVTLLNEYDESAYVMNETDELCLTISEVNSSEPIITKTIRHNGDVILFTADETSKLTKARYEYSVWGVVRGLRKTPLTIGNVYITETQRYRE